MASRFGLETFSRYPWNEAAPLASYTRAKPTPEQLAHMSRERGWFEDAVIPSALAQSHGGSFAYEFSSFSVDGYPKGTGRLSGYAFRGTNRPPDVVRAAGGFWAPATWSPTDPGKALAPDAYEPGKLPIEFGFRSPTQVSVFVSPYPMKASSYGDWTYAFLVEGALSVRPYEALVAGGVEWDEIVAYRRNAEKSLYLRDGFERVDPAGSAALRDALSFPVPLAWQR